MQIIRGRQYFQVRAFSTLREMFDQSVERYGDQTAFRFRDRPAGEPETRTYRELQADVQALGTALLDLDLENRRFAIIGENSYAWCLAHMAVINGVGVSVPLDRLLPEDELIGLLERGEVDAVFYDPQFHGAVLKAAGLLPRLRRLICLRPERMKDNLAAAWSGSDPSAASAPGQPVLHRLTDLLAAGRASLAAGSLSYRSREIDPDALMSLLFTSGTTSTSKAVMLSHRNICADVRGLAGMVKLPSGIRLLSILPLHHTFENTCGLFTALYVGGAIHECDGLRYIQKNMQEYAIDMVIGVPILFANFYNKIQDSLKKTGKDRLVKRMMVLTQALRRVGIDLRRTVFKEILQGFGGRFNIGICGAAPIDPEIIRFFDAIGVRILQGYGLTETSPVACGCNSKVFVPGTVGQPLPGVELAVDSPEPGEPGEILVRGDIVMRGYYGDADATAAVIDPDGWFHTGDIGSLGRKNHCLSITGRVKSMIVLKSGKKVFPEEIEYMFGQYDSIKESLVWGDQDNDGDVVVSAKLVVDREALQRQTGQNLDDNSVRQYLEQLVREINNRMPSFKGIRQYVFSFQEMVKTTTLKVRRPIEIGKIKDLMQEQKLKWQELTGQNLDQFDGKPGQQNGGISHAK